MDYIHAWHSKVVLPSPDGRYIARYEGTEIGMGAPSNGPVRIFLRTGDKEEGLATLWGVSSSMLWSSDSHCLILAFWSEGTACRKQEIVVYDVPKSHIRAKYTDYRIPIEFTSLKDGILQGTISPAFEPEALYLDLREVLGLSNE